MEEFRVCLSVPLGEVAWFLALGPPWGCAPWAPSRGCGVGGWGNSRCSGQPDRHGCSLGPAGFSSDGHGEVCTPDLLQVALRPWSPSPRRTVTVKS